MTSSIEAAYATCTARARAHYENFPVASRLVPAAMRPHIAAVYAFARVADDFADEGTLAADVRLDLLDGWRCRLLECAASTTPAAPARPGEPDDAPAIFLALGATLRALSLPVELFEDLLSAFRQDVIITRYETWQELADYCSRSANPVGRLVLRIAGYRGDRYDRSSDSICTALQLTNFWQDVLRDAARGRIYLPREIARTHAADESTLMTGVVSPAWRAALADVVVRTRLLFDEGRPLCDAVSGRLRYELRATWLGGTTILDRLERSGFDPGRQRPTIQPSDVPQLAWRMATWSARR